MAVENASNPLFLVYGPTGSGLSTALKVFREFRFLALAGVSPEAMDRFLLTAQTENRPLVLSPELNPCDITPAEVKAAVETLKKQHPSLKLLYLSCPTETLIQRFSGAEKPHPYERSGLRQAIEQEQLLYQALKPLSDYHIDTSTTTDAELRMKIAKVLNISVEQQPLTVHLTSFGFKHGVPTDAELVFDMRFLPNPFYIEALRPQTGLDKPVKDYVFDFPESQEFLTHWQNLLAHTLPLYQKQGKTRVTIGIGCTGGQHRSVAMTMALSEYLRHTFPAYDVRITHREQNHWPHHVSISQGHPQPESGAR